jgi:hypothetical protein
MVNQASICSIGSADVRATDWTHAIVVVEAVFCLALSLEPRARC